MLTKLLSLLTWIVPEDHKGEIVWAAKPNSQAVVVTLVGLALLASGIVVALPIDVHGHIALFLADLAWHWFRQLCAVVSFAKQRAPGCSGLGFRCVATRTQQSKSGPQAERDQCSSQRLQCLGVVFYCLPMALPWLFHC